MVVMLPELRIWSETGRREWWLSAGEVCRLREGGDDRRVEWHWSVSLVDWESGRERWRVGVSGRESGRGLGASGKRRNAVGKRPSSVAAAGRLLAAAAFFVWSGGGWQWWRD
ncbi:unnamed protein product [Linum trigynum]|uniref:Uncharacterized protein n=1 Tax=Linum trigynum TaxID=586398 RepID=A0AAV2GM31_9ROSI